MVDQCPWLCELKLFYFRQKNVLFLNKVYIFSIILGAMTSIGRAKRLQRNSINHLFLIEIDVAWTS